MADFTAGSVLTAAALNAAFNTETINAQTGTSYTLQSSDAGELVTVANASGGTVTIPANATWGAATGTIVNVVNAGSATWTIGTAAGVTLNGNTALIAGCGAVQMLKTDTNTWWALGGNLLDWTPWTHYLDDAPAVVGSGGSRDGWYTRIGKTVHFVGVIKLGSGFTIGSVVLDKPPVAAREHSLGGGNFLQLLFPATYLDVNTSNFYRSCAMFSESAGATTIVPYAISNAGGLAAQVAANTPFTWANGDEMYFHGTYEAA